jgi:outer membrane lipoprotein-sorting protein
MNCPKKILLPLAAVLFFVCLSYSNDYSGEFDDIVNRFSDVISVESKWTIERLTPVSKNPIISQGEFYFQKPYQFKWEQISPDKRGFLLDGKKVLAYQSIDGQTGFKDISNQKFVKRMISFVYAFVAMDIETLEKFYRIEKSEENSIVLYPKENSKKQRVQRIEVYFDNDAPAIRLINIVNKDERKTIISFDSILTNKEFDENIFSI